MSCDWGGEGECPGIPVVACVPPPEWDASLDVFYLCKRHARKPCDGGKHTAFDALKRDTRDAFVRIGAFHAGHEDRRFVTFRPHDARQHLQGNGEPQPDYAVRVVE